MHTEVLRRRFRPALLLGLASTGLAIACDPGAATQADASGIGAAELRIVNGAAAAMSVVVDGSVRVASMPPGTVSPALGIAAGVHRVEFRSPSSGAPLASVDVTPDAVGRALVTATRRADGTVKADVLADTAAIVGAGASKLRVLHLAANAPGVDIWRTQPDYATPIRFMFPFPYQGSSGFVQSTPGEWVVFVTPLVAPSPADSLGGGPPATVPARAIATHRVVIAGGALRTLVVLDVPGGGVKLEELP
ncbi:MAG: DUF4397 domain-containing protein [Gemmatimonadetes bacterium]|nr:DUF4397 domain-containing protein [Gemmatimonadota bacterium]